MITINYHSSMPYNRLVKMLLALCMTLGVLTTPPVFAQEEEEEPELARTRMSLTANQYPDKTIGLEGLLRARIEGAFQPVPMEKVIFYSVSADGTETLLGESETGQNGIAPLNLKAADLTADAEGYLSFIARFAGNSELAESEGDLLIRPAKLDMTAVESDSVLSFTIQAMADSPEGPQPIPEAAVAVYVKRMFSSLKVGEGTTDSSGQVSIEFPNDLAGDENSNLYITARIDETEEFGNLVATSTQAWGSPVSAEIREAPPALWSPQPPMWMFVTFVVLMVAVWGHYVIVIIKMRQIARIGKRSGAQG